MNNDKHTNELREIELLDEDLEPIAGGGGGGIATNPGGGVEISPIRGIDRPVLRPIGDFNEPILKDPLLKVGGGVNRGFPGGRPEVEDVEVTAQIKWANAKP